MLVAFEGIDGAGKRTQTELLCSRLEEEGRSAALLSFPRYGKTLMAHTIAEYLNGRFGDLNATPPEFAALLYAGDRLESRELLLEKLSTHDVVVVDRYVASNAAYQAAKLEEERREHFLRWLDRLEYGVYGLPQADATVYLDVPVSLSARMVAMKDPRDYTEDAADLHERNAAYMERCRQMYLSLLEAQNRSRWLCVGCTGPGGELRTKASIHKSVRDSLVPVLGAGSSEVA